MKRENIDYMVKRDIVKIPVEREIANRLRKEVSIGETYSEVIERLLENK